MWSVDDQSRFAAIEEFIEREVFKLPVPEELGEAPAYEPKKSGGKGRGRGGKGGHRGGKGRGKGGDKAKKAHAKASGNAGDNADKGKHEGAPAKRRRGRGRGKGSTPNVN